MTSNRSEGPSANGERSQLHATRYVLVTDNEVFRETIGDFERWSKLLEDKVTSHLFCSESDRPAVPIVQVETEDFDGIAYAHDYKGGKRIVVSDRWIRSVPPSDRWNAFTGVLLHEFVHAFQNNGGGKMPGYMVESVADFVRLRGGFRVPSWSRDLNNPEASYGSGALFLDWVDSQHVDFVKELNKRASHNFDRDRLFHDITSEAFDTIWKRYQKTFG